MGGDSNSIFRVRNGDTGGADGSPVTMMHPFEAYSTPGFLPEPRMEIFFILAFISGNTFLPSSGKEYMW